MRYFGNPYPNRVNPAPVYEEMEETQAPIGEECPYCSKPIEEGDSGFMIPFFDVSVVHEQPWHRLCLLSNILGDEFAHELELELESSEKGGA
jgi:hypothetical protein